MQICLICNKSFSKKSLLKTHEESIHKKIKFDCQECGKQYTRSHSLTNHINSTHKGIKYKCEHCDKEFKEKSTKTKHVKSFHDQKKYPCTLCDYQAQNINPAYYSIHLYTHKTCLNLPQITKYRLVSLQALFD